MLSAGGLHNRGVRDGEGQQSAPGKRRGHSMTPVSIPRSGVSDKLRALQAIRKLVRTPQLNEADFLGEQQSRNARASLGSGRVRDPGCAALQGTAKRSP